jgi:hypothetical protein
MDFNLFDEKEFAKSQVMGRRAAHSSLNQPSHTNEVDSPVNPKEIDVVGLHGKGQGPHPITLQQNHAL